MAKKTKKKAKRATDEVAEELQHLRESESWIAAADGVCNWDIYIDDLPEDTPVEVKTALSEFVTAQEAAKAKFMALENALAEAIW